VGSVLIIAMVDVPLFINILVVDVQQAATDSGLLLSALTLSMAVSAYIGGRMTEVRGYRSVAVLGVVAIVAGFLATGLTWINLSGYFWMAIQLALLGIGFGLVMAPIGAAVVNAAPERQRGVAASLVIVLRLIGMSVGLSALTAFGLKRFNVLRTRVELPPLSDPGFSAAIADALQSVTLQVLADSFLVSAGIAVIALGVAFLLHASDTKPVTEPGRVAHEKPPADGQIS
jgi:MFS family permease